MDGSRCGCSLQISFGFNACEDFASRSLLHTSPPPLLFHAIWLVLFPTLRTKSSSLLSSSSRVASRPVTRTLPGLRRFSPTVLRFFCIAFFSGTFLLFFWVFLEELVSRMNVGCVAYFEGGKKRRHTTTREYNSTLTRAEERRGQSQNFLRTFIYWAAQPSSSTSGEVVLFTVLSDIYY